MKWTDEGQRLSEREMESKWAGDGVKETSDVSLCDQKNPIFLCVYDWAVCRQTGCNYIDVILDDIVQFSLFT